ncbi:MAG: hypothetical protein EZS28_003267 [Streblomastix strix]|uniref:Uncharacterized protein n=1 Tax=Streblomastix strix TaxID=222440 RepID=A0A5J4X378_9EUKA|nr:MAG: hypothetical protein EZS28_003267 [Streblomastix strix]
MEPQIQEENMKVGQCQIQDVSADGEVNELQKIHLEPTRKEQFTPVPNAFHIYLSAILTSWVKPYSARPGQIQFENGSSRIELSRWVCGIQVLSRVDDLNLLVAMIYLQRLRQQYPDLPFAEINVHRLFLTSLILASKFYDDVTLTNRGWKKASGNWFELGQVNSMERELLGLLGYNLRCQGDELLQLMELTSNFIPNGFTFGSLAAALKKECL